MRVVLLVMSLYDALFDNFTGQVCLLTETAGAGELEAARSGCYDRSLEHFRELGRKTDGEALDMRSDVVLQRQKFPRVSNDEARLRVRPDPACCRRDV